MRAPRGDQVSCPSAYYTRRYAMARSPRSVSLVVCLFLAACGSSSKSGGGGSGGAGGSGGTGGVGGTGGSGGSGGTGGSADGAARDGAADLPARDGGSDAATDVAAATGDASAPSP